MPAFALRSAPPTQPVVGLIAHGPQVGVLCEKLVGRSGLMVVMGESWLAAFSEKAEANLPWMPEPPTYLYQLAPKLLCQVGLEPDVPKPLIPSLVKHLASEGLVALTEGPTLWDFSAVRPLTTTNLEAIA
ncbi:hypothetical protein [Halovulum sp. GXIMD14793]